MDTNALAATVGYISQAVSRLLELVSKFCGPGITRRQADADIYAALQKAKSIRENPDMGIEYTEDGQLVRARTPEELVCRAEQRELGEAIRQQNNLEAVLETAFYEIEQVTESSDESVDEDWFVRFLDIAKDISNEDMQRIWGKILAGEISKPGSFSLRTLDIVRNLSQKEAAVFQRVAPLIIIAIPSGACVISREHVTKYGVTYGEIVRLDECGLVNSNPFLSLTATVSDEDHALALNRSVALGAKSATNATEISTGVYTLTAAGQELFRIVETEPNDEYFLDFAESVYNANGCAEMVVERIRSEDGSTFNGTGEIVRIFNRKSQ